jgi:hypothetical protein
VIRPGPLSLPPGQCPGGVVIHVYSVPSCVLLLTQHVPVTANVEHAAVAAGERVANVPTDVCLVAFDGDSGERYSAGDWTGLLS